jgi:hypothetical protein
MLPINVYLQFLWHFLRKKWLYLGAVFYLFFILEFLWFFRSRFIEQSSVALGVTKFVKIYSALLVTLCCAT